MAGADAAEDFDASAASAGAWNNSARETASDGPPGRCTGGRCKWRSDDGRESNQLTVRQ